MAQLTISNKVISNVNNENLAAMLNELIDIELSKSDSEMDTDFVNECVDALLQLENEENGLVALVPLMSSDKFLKSITKDNKTAFKNLNIFVRTAIIAAIIAGGTLTANAAIETVTGVNVLHEFTSKVQGTLQDWGWINNEGIEIIEGVDDDDDEETTTKPSTTEKLTEESTTQPQTTTIRATSTTQPTTQYEGIEVIEGVDDDDDEPQTTKPVTTQPTTQYEGIEIIEGVDDDDEETTTQPTTQYEGIEVIEGVDDDDEPTTEPATEATTKPVTTKPTVTSPKPITPVKPSPAQRNLENISADINDFKSDYIYGEEFDPSGIRLYANYDDGTSESISINDCYYTKLDLGNYTMRTQEALRFAQTASLTTCSQRTVLTSQPTRARERALQ